MLPKNRSDLDGGESPLKQLREAVGLTQEELARRIGVSTKTISNWERGAYPATFIDVNLPTVAIRVPSFLPLIRGGLGWGQTNTDN
ncbi:MAG: helix-turn-helix transcriptional regulator [Coleofasciculus sp. C2-GNP5-27]